MYHKIRSTYPRSSHRRKQNFVARSQTINTAVKHCSGKPKVLAAFYFIHDAGQATH